MEDIIMKQLVKMITLLFVLSLTFSLMGCNATPNTSKEQSKSVKTTKTTKIKSEIATKPESSKETTNKQKSSNENVSTEVSPKPQSTTATEKPTTNVVVKNKTTPASKQTEAVVQNKTATAATSSTPKTSTTSKGSQVPLPTVTLSITGPKDHRAILATSRVNIKDGNTILEVLLKATQKNGIDVDFDGSGSTAYVNGIDNFYEFDYGPKSGWLFKLNGISLTKSIGIVKIKAGDRIECYYTE